MLWLGLVLMLSTPVVTFLWLTWTYYYLRRNYLKHVLRIFQEKPLFVVPRGEPATDAEEVRFPTSDNLTLCGSYFKTTHPRRGVILFGLEFGSNRWSCLPYCEHLLDAGYDVFSYEPRNQGESDRFDGYDPLQWVTEHEIADARAAVTYLRGRADHDARGIGLFGISKGAGAGLHVAAEDRYVRCCVTDGVFATYTTLVPYMRHWFRIYNSRYAIQGLLPSWYYGLIGLVGLGQIGKQRNCCFPHLEKAIRRISPRPLLMIHGRDDTYIKPEMAEALYMRARKPKELWLVDNAKHNQALQVADLEYRRRVLDFFDAHLAPPTDE